MERSLQHVIFTRFNLAIVLAGKKSTKIHDPEWLLFRFDLFRRFCYPSVAQQSFQEFKWFVLFDPESPEWVFELMASEFPRATVIRTEEFTEEARKQWIEEHCPPSEWLLTSRLDSDDCIHREYIARIQEAATQPGVYNFLAGFTMRSGRFYAIQYPCNAFASYLEPRHEGRTVFAEEHQNLAKLAKVHDIQAPPMWLQVIHGTNVGNDLYGVRVLGAQPSDFGIEPEPSWGADSMMTTLREGITCWLRNFSRQTGIGKRVRRVLGRG